MRFEEPLHWAEGQFLQPHHFQEQDRINYLYRAAERSFYLYYQEGLIEFKLDAEALKSRRVAVTQLSAILPDGLAVSMPGNIELETLTLNLDANEAGKEITVCLSVPLYSLQDPNLSENQSMLRRYGLHEVSRADANTADNETILVKHRYCAKLITDPSTAGNCAILPLVKLRWQSIGGEAPVLEIADEYIPPYVVVPANSTIFKLVSELIYELKLSRDKIVSDLDADNYDPKAPSGEQLLQLMRLKVLNEAVSDLRSVMVPGSVTPSCLYERLSRLLAGLLALEPRRDQNSIIAYDHYNLSQVFKSLALNIRAFLSTGGKASYIQIAFEHTSGHTLQATLSDEHLIKGRQYYLSLELGEQNSQLISMVEAGDNLRVLDQKSVESRMRGIKLTHLRYPPRFLPSLEGKSAWFRLEREESARMWRYIVEDKSIVIDYAEEIFERLQASLFITVIDDAKA